MDVVDHLQQRSRLIDIAIVPSTGQPKSMPNALALVRRNFRQPFGSIFSEIGDSLASNRFLDRLTNHRNIVLGLSWMDDQMDVLGHENEGPKIEVQRTTCLLKRIAKPLTGPLRLKKLVSPLTGERELVGMSRLVVVSTMSPLGRHD